MWQAAMSVNEGSSIIINADSHRPCFLNRRLRGNSDWIWQLVQPGLNISERRRMRHRPTVSKGKT